MEKERGFTGTPEEAAAGGGGAQSEPSDQVEDVGEKEESVGRVLDTPPQEPGENEPV